MLSKLVKKNLRPEKIFGQQELLSNIKLILSKKHFFNEEVYGEKIGKKKIYVNFLLCVTTWNKNFNKQIPCRKYFWSKYILVQTVICYFCSHTIFYTPATSLSSIIGVSGCRAKAIIMSNQARVRVWLSCGCDNKFSCSIFVCLLIISVFGF